MHAADTGQAEYVATPLPRLSDADPSPLAPGMFSLVLPDVVGDAGAFAVVDLCNGHCVLASYKGDVGKSLHWWMPDGSLRRLHKQTGELSARQGRLQDGDQRIGWQVVGALPPPLPGYIYATAAPSPNGPELLLSTVEPHMRREDLWIADLRGGGLRRVTCDGFVSFVRWSPDGKISRVLAPAPRPVPIIRSCRRPMQRARRTAPSVRDPLASASGSETCANRGRGCAA